MTTKTNTNEAEAVAEARVALITGCTDPSLGAMTARTFRQAGWRVFASARRVETMEALRAEGCDLLELDVTSDTSIKAALDTLKAATGGRLDLLINNAGVAGFAPLLDIDLTLMQAMYQVNTFGPVRMIQACAPMLVHTAQRINARNKGRGHSSRPGTTVINITSQARMCPPWQGGYGSSKAALHALSDTMRIELAPLGVRVITVTLGPTRTAQLEMTNPFPLKYSAEAQGPFYPTFDTTFGPSFTSQSPPAHSTEQVAQKLLNAVENGKRGQMWAGGSTAPFRLFLAWVPWSVADLFWNKLLGLEQVGRDYRTSIEKEQEE